MTWAAGRFFHQVAATCSTHTGTTVHPSPRPDHICSTCCYDACYSSVQGWQLTLSHPETESPLSDSEPSCQCRTLLAHMLTRLATIELSEVSWLKKQYCALGYPARLILRMNTNLFCEHYPDSPLPHPHHFNTPRPFVSV